MLKGRRHGASSLGAIILASLLLTCSGLGNSASADSCPDKPRQVPSEVTYPPNLDQLKIRLLNYKCFGQYEREVGRVAGRAEAYVKRRASRVPKPALVLDIDETSLSNWERILANDFGYILDGECDLPRGPCGARKWEQSAKAPPITPTLQLFNTAKQNHVAVFFITGRRSDEREATENNLHDVGYDGWEGLIMQGDVPEENIRVKPGEEGSIAPFKTAARKSIQDREFTIIANVGDQQSDLINGYAERTFRLPNPFYFIK
jgi:hypothetical protein